MYGTRPLPHSALNLPATASVRLGGDFRYEGLWMEGRWHWTLWCGAHLVDARPLERRGSGACN